MLSEKEMNYLRRAVEQAKLALKNGDEPFGSVLVSGDDEILFEDHNHVASGDHTQHPEFAIARFAAENLTPGERARAVVYTSGEHCPMCAAAHGWVGLGKIVYASSSEQLVRWLSELGVKPSRVKNLAIQDVIRDTEVIGPIPELAEEVYQLHRENYLKKN